jgi:D-glycero-alpha-D-manno-heptose-7-phosphate kinase
MIKRSLSKKISTPAVDKIYKKAIDAGALGGKLLGAGGGGCILFFVKPEKQEKVKKKLNNLLHVPFEFENLGSQIVYYSRSDNNLIKTKV